MFEPNLSLMVNPYCVFKLLSSFSRDWRTWQEKPITLYWKTSKQSPSWTRLSCHYFSHHPIIYFGSGKVIFPLLLPPSDSQVCPSPTAAMSCRPPSRCRSSSARETPSTSSSASSSLTGCSRSGLIHIHTYTHARTHMGMHMGCFTHEHVFPN